MTCVLDPENPLIPGNNAEYQGDTTEAGPTVGHVPEILTQILGPGLKACNVSSMDYWRSERCTRGSLYKVGVRE